jgi:hypothetical protein
MPEEKMHAHSRSHTFETPIPGIIKKYQQKFRISPISKYHKFDINLIIEKLIVKPGI